MPTTRRSSISWVFRLKWCASLGFGSLVDLTYVDQDEVFGSAYATAVYVSSIMKLPKDKKVFVVGMKGLEEELAEEGISFIGGTVSKLIIVLCSGSRISDRMLLTTHCSRQRRRLYQTLMWLLWSWVWIWLSTITNSP